MLLRLLALIWILFLLTACASTGPGYDNALTIEDLLPHERVLSIDGREIITLDGSTCYTILEENGVTFEKVDKAKGVQFPIRTNSPLGGVKFNYLYDSDTYSIMDCRLAVALIEWGALLADYGVREVGHMRTYSPGAKVRGGRKKSGHSRAMAIDAAAFIFRNGELWKIEEDWSDRRRKVKPCKPGRRDRTGRLKRLRDITCKTADLNLFQVILTPHYNRAHHDHLHLELDWKESGIIR
ncbi:MAG: extensin family protein [Deltaproteobacteria bacterium]|nr:extensin family protein [Deltaproteobacteria bacterium]